MKSDLFLRRMAWLTPLILPLYLVRFRLGPFPATILELYILVFVVVYLRERGLPGLRSAWQKLNGWRWPVIAWFGVTLLAVFISPSVWTGFGLWRAYVLEPLIMFLLVADVLQGEEDRRRLRQSFFWIVPILFVWAMVQFLTGWGIPHPWDVAIAAGRRATGPFPYPNALALFVAPIAVWAFVVWLHERRDRAALTAWVSGFIAIALARSEGGLGAFLLTVFIVLCVTKSTRRLAGWIAGFSLIFLIAFPAVRQKLWHDASFQNWSGQVRLFQWRETWQMLKDHPIFGAGFGGYPVVFKPYHKATAIEIFQYPHNILLNFWSETGLLGVIVFVWIVITWARLALRKSRPILALVPLLAILIHGLVDVPYFKNDLALEFWLLAFLTTMG